MKRKGMTVQVIEDLLTYQMRSLISLTLISVLEKEIIGDEVSYEYKKEI